MGDDCSQENNLYRIISVDSDTNQTKVIKATSLGNMKWNEESNTYTATGSAEDTAMGLSTEWTYTNIWAIKKVDGSYYKASLNEYLNTEYLTEIEKRTDKIVNTTWSVAGVDDNTLMSKNVKEYMKVELNNAVTYEAKIGLIYGNEYGYAALPKYWTKELSNYGPSKGYNWMYSSDFPWTISRISSYPDLASYVYIDSYIEFAGGGVDFNLLAVLPSFNLSSGVKITNANSEGVGTKANPMILI